MPIAHVPSSYWMEKKQSKNVSHMTLMVRLDSPKKIEFYPISFVKQ